MGTVVMVVVAGGIRDAGKGMKGDGEEMVIDWGRNGYAYM